MSEKACRASIRFSNDPYDPEATFWCQLAAGHAGVHAANGQRGRKQYTIMWSGRKEQAAVLESIARTKQECTNDE